MPSTTSFDIGFLSLAKDPQHPNRNEDRCITLPGYAYAVIDGVSDKSGLRYQGKTGGQVAGKVIEEVIRHECQTKQPEEIEAEWLIRCFVERFQEIHKEMGSTLSIKTDPTTQFGAQLVLALEGQSSFRFIIIGDCGLRINGLDIFFFQNPMDVICSSIRKAVWYHLGSQGVVGTKRNEIARAYTVNGLGSELLDWSEWINEDALQLLMEVAFKDLEHIQEKVDGSVIKKALLGGIRKQSIYMNRIHPLGFPCINGFPIPRDLIKQFDYKTKDIETIELFSDGYFGCPKETQIKNWEEHIAQVEIKDPEKVGDFASTKGSFDGCFTDDRTILILHSKNKFERVI